MNNFIIKRKRIKIKNLKYKNIKCKDCSKRLVNRWERIRKPFMCKYCVFPDCPCHICSQMFSPLDLTADICIYCLKNN